MRHWPESVKDNPSAMTPYATLWSRHPRAAVPHLLCNGTGHTDNGNRMARPFEQMPLHAELEIRPGASEIPGRAELAGRVDVTCQTAQLDTPIAFRECAPIDCCRHVVAPNNGRWKDAKDVKVPEPRVAELLIDGTGADAHRQHLVGASPTDKISPGIRGDARVADKVAAVGQVAQTVNSTSDHIRQMYIIPVTR